MNTPKLFVELVPKTCWFSNVRSQVSKEDWDWLRKETYKQAGNKCECCDTKGKMEAHEVWHYDDVGHIQKLAGLLCLCHECHQCFHLGYASVHGDFNKTKKHLAKVNGCSLPETELFVSIVFETFYRRSRHNWTLDLTMLDNCGIVYNTVAPKERVTKLF